MAKKKVETITIDKRVYEALLQNKRELLTVYELGIHNMDVYKEVYEILDKCFE